MRSPAWSRLARARLVAGVLSSVLVVAVWLMAGSLAQREREQAVAAETTLNLNLVLADDERVARSLRVVDQFLLLLLRNDVARIGAPREPGQRVAVAHRDRRFVIAVWVVDPKGHVVATASAGAPADFGDRPYFLTHAADSADRHPQAADRQHPCALAARQRCCGAVQGDRSMGGDAALLQRQDSADTRSGEFGNGASGFRATAGLRVNLPCAASSA